MRPTPPDVNLTNQIYLQASGAVVDYFTREDTGVDINA